MLLEWNNPGIIDVREWARTRPAPSSDREVVVGRYSRDDVIKFPRSFASLVTAYSFPEGYRVRMMGGASRIRQLAAEARLDASSVPGNWEILPHKAMDVRDFLDAIDFFVYYDNPERNEAFGRVLLEAAASGVVTIADPRHRDTFGDAIDYAPPGGAQELVARYTEEPHLYRRRSEESRRIVAERFGFDSFARNITAELNKASPAAALREGQGVQVVGRLDLTIEDRGTTRPLQVTSRGDLKLQRVPIRTPADAAQMDEVVLVHAGSDRDIATWFQREAMTGPEDVEFADASLATAPAPLVCVLQRTGRSVRMLARANLEARVEMGLRRRPARNDGWREWSLIERYCAFEAAAVTGT